MAADNSEIIEVCAADEGTGRFSMDFYACMKNDLINGFHTPTTLKEAKLLRIIISRVLEDAEELTDYRITVTELADILGITSGNIYRDIEELCENLHTRYVSIKHPDGRWENISWVSRSYYDGKYINITLSEDIRPYVLGLEKNFLKLQVREIVRFSSYYGLRLYEILKTQWCYRRKNVFRFKYPVEHLHDMLTDKDKFKEFGHFRSRVLGQAVDSINANPDALFSVSMETCRTGRSITDVIFTVIPRETDAPELEKLL